MPLSHLSLLLPLLILCSTATPVDFLLGQEYHGQYVATQPGVLSMPPRKPLATWMNVRGKSRSSSTDLPIGKCSTASRCCCWIPNTKMGRQCWWISRDWSRSRRPNGSMRAITSLLSGSGGNVRKTPVCLFLTQSEWIT